MDRERRHLRLALAALIALAPLPFASVEPWAVLGIEIGAALIGLLTLRIIAQEPEALTRPARRVAAAFAVLLAIGLVQWLPLPPTIAATLGWTAVDLRQSVAALVPEIEVTWPPFSLESPATLEALLRGGAYLLIGLAAAVAVRETAEFRQLAWVVVAVATFEALYGAAEYLTGHQHIFFYRKAAWSQEATGTFINRNHFAGFLVIALPLTIGLLVEALRERKRRLTIFWSSPAGYRAATLLFAVACMWVGVVLSYSRSGFACALAVIGLTFLGRSWPLAAKALLAAALAIPVVWLLLQDVRAPAGRFTNVADLSTGGGRFAVWESSLAAFGDHWLVGSGLGTWRDAFLVHRAAPVRLDWTHAHNDWLQWVVEGGVVGAGGLVGLAVVLALVAQRLQRPRTGAFLNYCALIGAFGAGTQSLVDFGLSIPANAVLVAALVGMALSFRGADPLFYRAPGAFPIR